MKSLIKFPKLVTRQTARRASMSLLLILLFSGFTGEKPARDLYDTVLLVSPIRAKAIYPGATFDAVEGGPEHLPEVRAVVQLEVQDVLVGKFIEIEPRVGVSKLDQAKEAAKDKNVLKILTMDFETRDEKSTLKKWITVAVKDPEETFGLTDWENPKREKLKLYLKRVPNQKDTFVLIQALKK